MGSIDERKTKSGKIVYDASVRRRGQKKIYRTFLRLTDVRNWVLDTESDIRNGRHHSPQAEPQEERDARIVRRLNRIDYRWQILERQHELISEAFAYYVRMWLAHTPEVPESEKPAAACRAHERFERYTANVIRSVSKHETFMEELPKEVKPP